MDEKRTEKIELIKKSFEFKHLKKYKEAIEMLYKALEYGDCPQDNIEILSQIGDLHILLKNYDRALDEFQRAIAINKDHIYSRQKCYEIYFETNQFNKALKIASRLCEEHKSADTYHNYLKTLIKLEKYQDAFEIFNALDEEFKLDTDILYLISTISGQKQKTVLEKIVSLDETHEKANVDLIKIEFKNKNYDKVIKYCLNLNEKNPYSLYYLARVESIKHNFSKAIALYLDAIKADNDIHDYYFDLAKAYIDVSWLDEALLMLKKSINFSLLKNDLSKLDEKYFLTGWILIKQNQDQKALLNFDSINKNSPFYPKAQVLIQTINLKNSNLSLVVSQLEKYYEKEQNNPILLDTLALTYKELKLYKKAIQVYKKALELYPDSIYYSLELIDLLIDDKNYEKAMELINSLGFKHKNCVNIYNSLARVYYRMNDLDNALKSLNIYLELDYNCAEAHYFRGLVLNDLENFEEAKKSIYNAIKINPASAKYYFQMARSYAGLKEYENALLYSKEAIEIDPDEINYKKQAYDISVLTGAESQIALYKKQLERSEKILKLRR